MSRTPAEAAERIESGGLVAIVRRPDPEEAAAAALTMLAAGVPAVEFSLAVEGALDALGRALAEAPPEALLGAGTVLDAAGADAALDVGARFLVSPGLAPEAAATARAAGILHVPGALTPTEVGSALAAGAPLVKLFPAGALGPGYARDLLAPFPAARLVATGGVDEANAAEFLAAGCAAVAIGSALDRIESPDALAATATRFVALASSTERRDRCR